MVFKRRQTDSDDEYIPEKPKKPSKKRKLAVERASSVPVSPMVEADRYTPERTSTPQRGEPFAPPPSIESLLGLSRSPILSGSLRTPHRRAHSMEPPASSPMSSVIDETPVKNPRGRPAYTPRTRRLTSMVRRLEGSHDTPSRQEYQQAMTELSKKKADAITAWVNAAATQKAEKEAKDAEERAQKFAVEQKLHDTANTVKAQRVLADLIKPTEEGGYNFKDLNEFFQSAFRPGGEQQASANVTRYVHRHGADLARTMFARSESAKEHYISTELAEIYQREGRAIQEILTRSCTTTVMELLKQFSMDQLAAELEEAAPWLWRALVVVSEPDKNTRAERAGESRKHKGLVFTTICALISFMRSQKANNFQLVIGLFLLGSGASKREMEVLAHAGLSVSYSTIIDHVKGLSKEGMDRIRELVKGSMCQIVWDNLNIAFRVAAERLKAKNHFDNGTTATVIPVFDPATGGNAQHGTLPFSMKPPRERTLPVLDWTAEDALSSPQSAEELSRCCFWQLRRLALEHIPGISAELRKALEDCPEIFQIPLHKTEQYPLPGMNLDESSLEGTLEVYFAILRHLGLDDALEAHGLMFDDGDLLTDSLKEKNSTTPIASMRGSVRRWGLFHGEMAGGRLTVNEHWGKPNSLWAGGLWWEHNKLLKRKPITAGCAHRGWLPNLLWAQQVEERAKNATIEEFNRVSRMVFDKLFSTAAVDERRAREDGDRDVTLENAILYNRDALFYVEFVQAIKKGDVGRVLNVLSIWMVMMRTPKTMPRYADAIFETLVRLKRFPPKLRELFLVNWLEHQNFWAKIIYTAKGTNKSWEWLSMITVCIFTLQTQDTPINDEVTLLANALQSEKIQSFVPRRPANEHVDSVRDLIREGSRYGNTRKAFKRFTRETRKAEKRGFTAPEPSAGEDDEDEDEGQEEDYEPTEEDLRADDEEFFDMSEPAELLSRAMDIVDNIMEE
ncbi:hypothetical protein B0H13DRAFT_2360239 [Mycena leptocephala]|nr:hypothetical protein B0H13DRAFT_2360239 [Mycena leptocephala]